MAVVCALAAAGAIGCGGDRKEAAPPSRDSPPTPAAIEICGSAGSGWRELDVGGADAAALGRGPAVVFLNDSSDDTCTWMPVARATADSGRTAVVFQYGSVAPRLERKATNTALAVAAKAAEGGRFVLIGASLGGRIVFEAAARMPEGLAGVVSLSGERRIDAYRDILPDVRHVRVPVLYAGARQDTLTQGTRQPDEIRAALPSREARFMLLPGYAHGTELLHAPPVRRAVDRFLAQTLPL